MMKSTGTDRRYPCRQFGNFIAQELDLDASQQEQFRDFRRVYNRSANRTLMAMNSVRSRMARELRSVDPDRDQLDQLAENSAKCTKH
jgi:hypothetical protein